MAEDQKNVAAEEYDHDFVENEVKPLDAMVDDDNSESDPSLKWSVAHKKLDSYFGWIVQEFRAFTNEEQSAAVLLVQDAYRSHGHVEVDGVNLALLKKISQEMTKKFGGYWNVVGGHPNYHTYIYTNKYIKLYSVNTVTNIECYQIPTMWYIPDPPTSTSIRTQTRIMQFA